jgi:hypothetical protein
MRFGSLVDAIAFGKTRVAVWDGQRRGKAWESFAADNADRLVVTDTEFARASACAMALRAHPQACELLDAERQRPIAWKWMGRDCGSTLDVINPGRWIADLKTARTTQPMRFRRACLSMGYHAQQRFYGMAAEYAGLGRHEHYIVGIESAPPWAITIFRLVPRALLEGEKLCRSWFEQLLTCEASNEWPAYSQSIIDLDTDEDSELIFDDPEPETPNEEAA